MNLWHLTWLLPVVYMVQTTIHECSHLVAGVIFEGRRPLKLPWMPSWLPLPFLFIPWRYKGRWWFGASNMTKASKVPCSPVIRYAAPLIVDSCLLVIYALVFPLWPWQHVEYWVFFGAAFIDLSFWLWGMKYGSDLTDGKRLRHYLKKYV